jgi:C_GCAxxG_C_C family probable redox protein
MRAESALESARSEIVADVAGELFDRGNSCTRSVLQATSGTDNQDLMAAAAGFSCGIGASGCLCGAITGGVMSLGLQGRTDRCAELMAAFKEVFQTTCCRSLSKNYTWMGAEHQANCRKITVTTARIIERLLQEQ